MVRHPHHMPQAPDLMPTHHMVGGMADGPGVAMVPSPVPDLMPDLVGGLVPDLVAGLLSDVPSDLPDLMPNVLLDLVAGLVADLPDRVPNLLPHVMAHLPDVRCGWCPAGLPASVHPHETAMPGRRRTTFVQSVGPQPHLDLSVPGKRLADLLSGLTCRTRSGTRPTWRGLRSV